MITSNYPNFKRETTISQVVGVGKQNKLVSEVLVIDDKSRMQQ